MKVVAFISAVLVAVLSLSGCFGKSAKSFEISGETMGTSYQITVVAPPKDVDQSDISTKVTLELERLNDILSTYDPESQLSKFNEQKTTDWIPMDSDTLDLVEIARRISKETSGAYDVTMGSVSRLWGFGPGGGERKIDDIPDMDEIMLHLNNIGYQLLQIRTGQQTLRKLSPDLRVDLSSLGKGFAVDKLGQLLEAAGISRYLVEIGGEIRTRGMAADGERWKIGIELPVAGQSDAPSGVTLEDGHVATSGDYRNYKEVDGRRYSHLLDGRTGFPISHNLASVTLLHGSTTLADAWATVFMVLGFDDAFAIASDKGLAASFTVREGDGFVVRTTPAFDAYKFSGT